MNGIDTLVLDTSMIPISLTNRRKAISMIYNNRAIAIDYDRNECLRSEKHTFLVPRVIKINKNFDRKNRRRIAFSRKNVIVRDSVNGKPQCQYCLRLLGYKEVTFDHIIPKSKGGESNFLNLIVSCINCNKKKDDYTPEECGMYPFREPTEPSIYDKRFNHKLRVNNPFVEWEPYIDFLHIIW